MWGVSSMSSNALCLALHHFQLTLAGMLWSLDWICLKLQLSSSTSISDNFIAYYLDRRPCSWMGMEHWWNDTDRAEPKYSREKPVPVPHCPPQFLPGLEWELTRASAVKSRRTAAYAMNGWSLLYFVTDPEEKSQLRSKQAWLAR